MSALHAYADRYGKLIATATDGELSADAVAAGVAEHIHHMIAATDAYEAGDFTRAFQFQREAYAAMFGTAKSLASAAVTRANGELPVAFDSPGENLKSGLGQLLGEHVELAFDATRAIVAGQPAAEAAAQALNENTQDILTAMQGAVGDQASAAFGRVWAKHINALVAFSVGVADDNDKAQVRRASPPGRLPGKAERTAGAALAGQRRRPDGRGCAARARPAAAATGHRLRSKGLRHVARPCLRRLRPHVRHRHDAG